MVMKAIVQDTYGSADVLEVRDIAPPSIGEEDVLVRVVAAGVDRGAWHFMTGQPYLMRILGFGFRSPKTPVPGTNVAGRVEAVGKNVTRFHAGDEVYGTCRGAFAEYARASQDRLASCPTQASLRGRRSMTAAASKQGSRCSSSAHPAPWGHSLCSSPRPPVPRSPQ